MAERTFVVGDLHGCIDELNVLLDALEPGETDEIVFLGDYVDRGPSPRGVIDRLLRLRAEGPRTVFLKGNHEDMLLSFLGLGGRYGEAFLANGGGRTLESYGLEGSRRSEARERLPPEHKKFLLDLQLQHVDRGFLCVHAGISPRRALHEQDEEDLLWIREEFIRNPHDLGLVVVFGHTPQREVLIDLPYKLGLDTGVVYFNKLSCFELGEKELLQVPRGDRRVLRRSLQSEFAAAERR